MGILYKKSRPYSRLIPILLLYLPKQIIMESTCINCKFCTFKYDMFLCMKENMPEPVSSGSTCNSFEEKNR